MSHLLGIVGTIWAVLGVANLVMFDWKASADTATGVAVIFNMVLFIIPGLILIGIATRISKRRAEAGTAIVPANLGTADRLANLDSLLSQGAVTQDEYERKRAEILQSV